MGRIWGADFDLDVVVNSLDGTLLLGECKWWEDRVGLNVLETLRERRMKTPYGRTQHVQYALFSRSGFTRELKQHALNHPEVHQVSLERLLGEPDVQESALKPVEIF